MAALAYAAVKSPLWLLTGPPGAGKSSVAATLLRRFPFGIHIPVDDLREWVVSGLAPPVPRWTEETTRQFRVARQAAAQAAAIYSGAHFAVVIDDIIFPDEAHSLFVEPLSHLTPYKIVLLPRTEVALSRNSQRTTKAFDTQVLVEPIRAIRQALADQPFAAMGWHIIDNSELSVDETVDAIVAVSR